MPNLPLHLSHSGAAVDGGITTAVTALINAQLNVGLNPSWVTADQFSPLRRDPALLHAVYEAAPEILHVHGLWRSPTRIVNRLDLTSSSHVIAPHGMLDPGALAISRYKKLLVWRLWERRALSSAHCVHALCSAEAVSIRTLLPKAPIAVIPNGVELPCASDAKPTAIPPWADDIPVDEPVLLYLGRFHRKKGLEPLLSAWQAVASASERYRYWLVLVGYGDNGALEQHVSEAQRCGELQRLRVYGPVFGAEKASTLSSATAFVLPSFSEGLPMAALEAMAYQRPCLLSQACNLPQAFQVGAALPAEPELPALSEALERCFKLSSFERTAMGFAGQSLVRERFSWSQVAAQTNELYSWLLGGGSPPSFLEFG